MIGAPWVGWVAEVLVNRSTGNVVDGHLRIELALARHEPTVPVTYIEVTEAEEALVLATLDPIGAMANAEATALAALQSGLEPADEALRALLDDLTSRVEATYFDGRPVLFPATVRAWAEQLQRTEQLAAFAERLSELDGLDLSPPDDPARFEAHVERFVADHVEAARMKTFDEMGEGHRAMSVAMRWLGPSLG